MELQAGTVSVMSEEGKDPYFAFRLRYNKRNFPLKMVELSTPVIIDTSLKMNILLVEDNSMNQLLAKKVLSDWGWKVQIADNGIVALKILKEKNFDLVLMDIQMPEMDGYETTRQIRNQLSGQNAIPIIAMTAGVISSEEEKCYQIGMNGYISKPFDPDILYSKIISVVKKPMYTK
jgi:CheY-like chemotaxis protein